MKQIEPQFGRQHAPQHLAPVIGLDPEDFDNRFPIEEVSTGLPFYIVPLRNLISLKKAHIDRDQYFDLVSGSESKGILVFCPESHGSDNDFSVRVFVDYFGVPEDPATGSGNGCLAGYLVKHRYFGKDSIDVRVEQGFEIGRPSLLSLKSEQKGSSIEIYVGGKSILVARGKFI